MSAPTFSQLITRVTRRLSQVSGTAVQTYSEDLIAEMLQHKFDVLFNKFWWPGYSGWLTDLALDGSTGVVTTDLSDEIKRFTDILGVWYSNDDRPLPFQSNMSNPARLTGTRPRTVAPKDDVTRIFNVFPIASTGTVSLFRRTHPGQLVDDPDQEVHIDDQLMILGAVYDYLEDDATNPGAADKFLSMYEQRLETFTHLLNKGPFALDENALRIPTTWEEQP